MHFYQLTFGGYYAILIIEREVRTMSFDKAIEHKKEHRKPYRKLCEQIDKSCRCHGGCEYCLGNRMYQKKKELQKMLDREKDL